MIDSLMKSPFYTLRWTHITMERSTMLLMGKSTISMAIFNSYLYVYHPHFGMMKSRFFKLSMLPSSQVNWVCTVWLTGCVRSAWISYGTSRGCPKKQWIGLRENDREMIGKSLDIVGNAREMDWFKGKSEPETIDVPLNLWFSCKFSLKPIHWKKHCFWQTPRTYGSTWLSPIFLERFLLNVDQHSVKLHEY